MIGKRLLALIPLMFFVTLIAFSLTFFVPGDPAITLAGEDASADQVEKVRDELGLNDPIYVQYGRFVSDLAQGDLGTSLITKEPVTTALMRGFPITLSITFGALFVAVAIGIPAGILAASKPGSLIDRFATLTATIGVAVPSYWLALVLILQLAIYRNIFPAVGYTSFTDSPKEWVMHLILPSITLGTAAAAEIARQLRGSLVESLSQDYIRTAKSKGLSTTKIVGKHALKNASLPVVTVLGLQISALLGGTVIIEQIFGMPGIGSYAIRSVVANDIPAIQGVVVFSVLITVLANLLVDISYGYLNPKVRQA